MGDLKPSTRTLIKSFIYCVFISFIMLLFASNNSILYDYNYNNVYLLRDIDSKFILFIIEFISNTLLLFFSYRILRLFVDKHISKMMIPIIMVSICTSVCFKTGGTGAEYVLSLIMIGLYFYLRHFKKKMITNSEIFLVGILAGLSFVIDYYLFGLWLGFIIFIVLDYIVNRHQKKNAMKRLFTYLFGIILVVGIVFLLEYLTGNMDNYINTYYVNRFSFNLGNIFKLFLNDLWSLGVINYWVIISSIVLLFKLNINLFSKIGIVIMLLLMILGIYINMIDNNFLVIMSYYVIGILGISTILNDRLLDFIKYYHKGLIVFITILCILLCIFGANDLDNMKLINNSINVFKY